MPEIEPSSAKTAAMREQTRMPVIMITPLASLSAKKSWLMPRKVALSTLPTVTTPGLVAVALSPVPTMWPSSRGLSGQRHFVVVRDHRCPPFQCNAIAVDERPPHPNPNLALRSGALTPVRADLLVAVKRDPVANEGTIDASAGSHLRVEPSILYFGTPVVLLTTHNPDGTANLAPMSSTARLLGSRWIHLCSNAEPHLPFPNTAVS